MIAGQWRILSAPALTGEHSPRLQAGAVPSRRSGSTDMIWLQALHM
jgi:hypothetical protein